MELILFSIVIFVALRYLYWRRKYYRYKNQKIKKNKQHNLTFQSEWETNKEKGDKYELQILRYYKKQGYKVILEIKILNQKYWVVLMITIALQNLVELSKNILVIHLSK